jgi:hypothetical protein
MLPIIELDSLPPSDSDSVLLSESASLAPLGRIPSTLSELDPRGNLLFEGALPPGAVPDLPGFSLASGGTRLPRALSLAPLVEAVLPWESPFAEAPPAGPRVTTHSQSFRGAGPRAARFQRRMNSL